jgi:hypothetical protein
MQLLGQLEEGEYAEDPHHDVHDVHPEMLEHYLDVDVSGCRPCSHEDGPTAVDESGTDSPVTDMSEDEGEARNLAPRLEALSNTIGNTQPANVKQKSVGVPSHHNPFADPGRECDFKSFLVQAIQHHAVLEDYGILPGEWEDGVYLEQEYIKVGRCGQDRKIPLPTAFWLPRASLWVRALSMYDRVKANEL